VIGISKGIGGRDWRIERWSRATAGTTTAVEKNKKNKSLL
jgi:hypothetical protein